MGGLLEPVVATSTLTYWKWASRTSLYASNASSLVMVRESTWLRSSPMPLSLSSSTDSRCFIARVSVAWNLSELTALFIWTIVPSIFLRTVSIDVRGSRLLRLSQITDSCRSWARATSAGCAAPP